jgi:hypothetical protein
MPPRKEAEQFADVGIKDCWHPYGLQSLSPEKFGKIVTRILSGKFSLLNLRWNRDIRSHHLERIS